MTIARVRIGSREVEVEQAPLRSSFFSSHSSFALTRPAASVLEIKHHRVVRVGALLLCAVGAPFIMLGLLVALWSINFAVAVTTLLFGSAICWVGASVYGPRCRFNTTEGQLSIRSLGRTRRRPLAKILAVQVTDTVFERGGRHGGTWKVPSYQLNLVLDEPDEPRLFVAHNQECADMAGKAKILADFLRVPLLAANQVVAEPPKESEPPVAPPIVERPDPTRNWTRKSEPMPPFDLEAGTLGRLALGDPLEQAEFLGRPDRVEHYERPGDMALHYVERGFTLGFMPEFLELTCRIAPLPDVPPERDQGYSRPRLSGGIELTPETSIAQVRARFGPPTSEHDSPRDQTLTLVYLMDRFYMEFEFAQPTGTLLTWAVPI